MRRSGWLLKAPSIQCAPRESWRVDVGQAWQTSAWCHVGGTPFRPLIPRRNEGTGAWPIRVAMGEETTLGGRASVGTFHLGTVGPRGEPSPRFGAANSLPYYTVSVQALAGTLGPHDSETRCDGVGEHPASSAFSRLPPKCC